MNLPRHRGTTRIENTMQTQTTKSTTISYNTTVGELTAWLATMPAGAKLSVSVIKGDRPWDGDTTNISATWTG